MTDQGRKNLSDILRAIELIENFTSASLDYSDFLTDLKTQSAVERQFGIIGEAVNRFDKLMPESTLLNTRRIIGIQKQVNSQL